VAPASYKIIGGTSIPKAVSTVGQIGDEAARHYFESYSPRELCGRKWRARVPLRTLRNSAGADRRTIVYYLRVQRRQAPALD
jgi:hypothetical protein